MAWETTSGRPDLIRLSISSSRLDNKIIRENELSENIYLFLKGTDALNDDTETELSFSFGKNWETADNKTAYNVAGAKYVHKQTGLGVCIDHIKTDEKMISVMSKRGEPTNSDTWVGLIVDFQREEVKSNELTYDRYFPVSITEAKQLRRKSASTSSAQSATTVSPKEAAEAIAKRTEEYETFFDLCMEDITISSSSIVGELEEIFDSVH